jgi:hypothetical protein
MLHLLTLALGTARNDRSKLTFLHGPADIEVHRGSDGRFYILDTGNNISSSFFFFRFVYFFSVALLCLLLARVFPPCVPDRTLKVSHLYRMLRPELLRKQKTKLSADAFSNFGHGKEESREENWETKSDSLFRQCEGT